MIEIKSEYPYNDNNGLIRHYAEDEAGVKYGEAIDIYPCRYHYYATTEPIVEGGQENVN